ncbi:3-phosphoshikimate 1-carboxyvinyltransferase [Flavobacterium sp. CYK-4]|nr:3-phosphoshikimate 1-carboxyvinyltransferase [Flavobacterium lotistagni]
MKLEHVAEIVQARIFIGGSKSETNRLLLLQALYPQLPLENISDSEDSLLMKKALSAKDSVIDIHHAGTAMRFLTAYFAMQENREVVLTGSSRMKQRPIGILVAALKALGADISYEENVGYPPLRIKGKKLIGNQLSIPANVSSQYITALLLIAPQLENGLELQLEGEITSAPYLQMTLRLLNQIGVQTIFENNLIQVFPLQQPSTIHHPPIKIESDWTSVSYFYSIVALSKPGTQLTLSSFHQNSLQGDSFLTEIYQSFGVQTQFDKNTIILAKTHQQPTTINQQLKDHPDLAQTIAVTCFGLGIGCQLTGLHTLKIKETDRLKALQNELTKLGAEVTITDDSLTLAASTVIEPNQKIATYNDHRMAMAFAPLALKVPVEIENPTVVCKSYPNFWNDLQKIGFQISSSQ